MYDGNDSPPAGGTTPPTDQPSPQPAGAAPVPTPPPAAQAVVTAQHTEREVQLAQELEVEKVTRKQREQRINQLEDENRSLKTVTRSKPQKKSGWTLFH